MIGRAAVAWIIASFIAHGAGALLGMKVGGRLARLFYGLAGASLLCAVGCFWSAGEFSMNLAGRPVAISGEIARIFGGIAIGQIEIGALAVLGFANVWIALEWQRASTRSGIAHAALHVLLAAATAALLTDSTILWVASVQLLVAATLVLAVVPENRGGASASPDSQRGRFAVLTVLVVYELGWAFLSCAKFMSAQAGHPASALFFALLGGALWMGLWPLHIGSRVLPRLLPTEPRAVVIAVFPMVAFVAIFRLFFANQKLFDPVGITYALCATGGASALYAALFALVSREKGSTAASISMAWWGIATALLGLSRNSGVTPQFAEDAMVLALRCGVLAPFATLLYSSWAMHLKRQAHRSASQIATPHVRSGGSPAALALAGFVIWALAIGLIPIGRQLPTIELVRVLWMQAASEGGVRALGYVLSLGIFGLTLGVWLAVLVREISLGTAHGQSLGALNARTFSQPLSHMFRKWVWSSRRDTLGLRSGGLAERSLYPLFRACFSALLRLARRIQRETVRDCLIALFATATALLALLWSAT